MPPVSSIIALGTGVNVLEDDGDPNNNMSQLRRSDGTIIVFEHPMASLELLVGSGLAGASLVINLTDSLGAADFSVGDLADAAKSPDSITIENVETTGRVTLVSKGSIAEGSDADADADIVAGELVLSGGGIGTSANAVETQAGALEARSQVEGIYLANFGNVTIGSVTGQFFRGLDAIGTVGARDIVFVNSGSITMSQGAIGRNIMLIAQGYDADLISPGEAAVADSLLIRAGRDITADSISAGPVQIEAGRDVSLRFVDGDNISVTAGRNIVATGPLFTDSGNVALNAGAGGTVDIRNFGISVGTGSITIRADRMLFTGDVSTDSGSVTLTPVTAGRRIDIGSATDAAAALELSDVELDLVRASNGLFIGGDNSGRVILSGSVDPANVDDVEIRSGTDIELRGSIFTTGALTLRALDNVLMTSTATVDALGAFSAYVDAVDDDPGVGGLALLSGAIVTTQTSITGGVDGDTLHAHGFGSDLFGLGGNDVLRGSGEGERLEGGAGSDRLFGNGGDDVMLGGAGDDFFYVDQSGDTVTEVTGQGTGDRIIASVTYALTAGSEVEILSTADNLATTSINLTGNALRQFIFGNAGANSLDSGGGGDVMSGFGGNDLYFVRSSTDRAVEAAGAGTGDRVFAAVSFTLEAGSEVEILSTVDNLATTAINLTGNALRQFIFGNAGANNLDSGGGNDVLSGFGGDDRYFIRSAGDRAVEAASAGNDRVFAAVSFTLEAGSHVEMITMIDNLATTAISLTGNELVNTIFGNAGVNTLDGKGGSDTLVGLEGADTFAFTTALGVGNVDTISGFVAALDRIALDDAIFTGLAPGALPAGAFRTGTTAGDADDRIIYNSATGALLFDVDGVGAAAAVQFAVLGSGLALGASDFVVI